MSLIYKAFLCLSTSFNAQRSPTAAQKYKESEMCNSLAHHNEVKKASVLELNTKTLLDHIYFNKT